MVWECRVLFLCTGVLWRRMFGCGKSYGVAGALGMSLHEVQEH